MQPYDPNYHGLIDYRTQFEIRVRDATERELKLDAVVNIIFVDRDSKAPVGSVRAEADVELKNVDVPLARASESTKDGLDLENASEPFLRLIEGAIAEDIMMPLSVATRAMRLPMALPIPRILPRGERKDGFEVQRPA